MSILVKAEKFAKRHGLEVRGPTYDTVGPNMVYLRRPELPTLIEKR